MMLWLVIIAASAALNRVRGGGLGGERLPGRALFWAAPAMGCLAWLVSPWPVALGLAVAYFVWAVWGWGHLLSRLGGFAPPRSPSVTEGLFMALPGAWLPVFARQLMILPGLALIAWLKAEPMLMLAAPVFAGVVTEIHAHLFRSMDDLDWTRAEIATGAVWGAIIILVAA